MWCESCVDGNDLRVGSSCSVCGRSRVIVGYRKCEVPMTKEDENRDILITKITGDKNE